MSSAEPVVAQSNLSPASQTQGTPVQARLFKITDIPDAMEAIDWPVSAALMRHWFQGQPWPTENGGMSTRVKEHAEWPPAQYIEESIVKMSWVASFDKVKPVLAELRRSWNNAAAMGQIRKHLLAAYGDKAPGCYPLVFPNLASAVERFGYFNSRPITFAKWGSEGLNDLRGALADFNLRVAAEGEVRVYAERIEFQPRTLLFYAEDNYDFNDDGTVFSQPLGFWNFDGIAPSLLQAFAHNAGVDAVSQGIMQQSLFGMNTENQRRYMDEQSKRYMLVLNSHFAEYRTRYNKGGDFRVFSDLLREPLPPGTSAINIAKP
ncbi:DUF6402 family protein [Pseudomonas sp. GOM7]|uniref:DUF6402 family protein n=1 Tax=unclassified Pseudomonas TaxID=196821 RepID=UPI00227D49A9|nr:MULTISPECIES: DUF6402 family protein [unclassified Pseudomonas]WAJ36340.1 DUF6402 family protein [Pseudomonas sp. GOM7]